MSWNLPQSVHYLAVAFCLLGAWVVIGGSVVLTVAGFIYSRQGIRQRRQTKFPEEWPGVSILVPAHNEELVIAGTIESMLHLDYPLDKLEVIVIDDSSTDRTRRIIEQMMASERRLKLVAIPLGLGGKGKSYALNVGLRYASHDLIAVYDADNSPESPALRYLVAELLTDQKLAATVGKVRTLNQTANFLTRCIAIEFMSFQWMMQAGRWLLFRLASLPGTNYVIRREALEQVGGWDTSAIADDAELTLRLSQAGYQTKFIPYAVTWEPEPQDWEVWLRQRLRWARGGTYVVRKFLPRLPRFRRRDLALDVFYLVTIYYFFFAILIASDLLLAFGLLVGFANFNIDPASSPLTVLWALALGLFLLEIALALAIEREHTPINLLVALSMYFTYCQLWLYVCAKAHFLDVVRQERLVWEKTTRTLRPSEVPYQSSLWRS